MLAVNIGRRPQAVYFSVFTMVEEAEVFWSMMRGHRQQLITDRDMEQEDVRDPQSPELLSLKCLVENIVALSMV